MRLLSNRLLSTRPLSAHLLSTLLLLCLIIPFSGCASHDGHWVELAGKRYQVELAMDNASRTRGLMFRDQMPPDHGMLFLHDELAPQAYWMKNTKIALDILYFDDERKLVSQQRDVPPCTAGDRCPGYPSGRPALYVLELNAGQAALLNLSNGAELILSPSIPASP